METPDDATARLAEALENVRERAGRRCAPHEAAIRLQGIRADCDDALADPSTAALLRRREAEKAVIDWIKKATNTEGCVNERGCERTWTLPSQVFRELRALIATLDAETGTTEEK